MLTEILIVFVNSLAFLLVAAFALLMCGPFCRHK